MIDLIIPYYNNPDGLIQTLNSINKNIFYVTIIDDGSDLYIPYHPVIDQVFRQTNQGPGQARQRGIEKTTNPYIMFLDTGDIFLSQEIQKEITRQIYINPDANIISFPYYHKDALTSETDNRMHGKVYKRKFIEEYGITFCADSSYLDEDIGFNRTCRYLTDIEFLNTPIIKQINDENSLTQKDNQASLYRDQTRALSLVSIHTINICKNNNIDPQKEINTIAIALYYWFIRTAAERSEFIQDAWSGARIFYKEFQNEIIINQLTIGNAYLKQCLKYRKKIIFPINILRFAHDIQIHEIIPAQYKEDTCSFQ